MGLMLLAGTFVLLGSAPLLRAHDSPEHEVDALTLRIAKVGKTSSLLSRRALEYRALGQLDKAAADLAEAIVLDPKMPSTYVELARVQFAQEKLADACNSATLALQRMDDPGERGPVFLLRAQIQAARGNAVAALADCDQAERKDDIDWYLVRSEVQAQLKQFDARTAGLQEGFERNGSIVLEIEWIEAMIDAGKYQQALARINQHLDRLRWRSSWLLRRARVLKATHSDFRPDAQAALAELNQRINPGHPETMLLLDRATAYALLGDKPAASKDLAAAKKLGASELRCARVERLLKESTLARSDRTIGK